MHKDGKFYIEPTYFPPKIVNQISKPFAQQKYIDKLFRGFIANIDSISYAIYNAFMQEQTMFTLNYFRLLRTLH